MLIHEQEKMKLADKFKKILSKKDAIEFATVLLSGNSADLGKISIELQELHPIRTNGCHGFLLTIM